MLVACAMVAPSPEATPAPTPKATPAPSPEATPAPTPEATPAPTPEATPALTPKATLAPTPEATPAPTPEATPAPTPKATPAPTPEATPAPTPEVTLGDGASVFDPFLKAVDHEIRDNHGQGDVIYLRGVNLGGWLLFEGWMTPILDAGKEVEDDWSVREVLAARARAGRLGADTPDSLIASYEDAWITEADLDNIAALGFNVIRLPFWYRNLQEEDGTWRPDRFEKIDWLVTNAWKRHIYVILDFHGLPGGQSENAHTGRKGKNELWNNNEYLKRSTKIWQEVAKHFKNNPAVAAYDLINEPEDAPDRDKLWYVYNHFYKAVRKIDPDHIVTLEAFWKGWVVVDGKKKYVNYELDVLPDPNKFHWTNVVYQMHSYVHDHPNDLEKQHEESKKITDNINAHRDWKDAHHDWNVPFLVGEFNCMELAQAWDDTIRQYEENQINWTMWTYKAVTKTNNWGVYNPKDSKLAKPDIWSASFSEQQGLAAGSAPRRLHISAYSSAAQRAVPANRS
jgi:endoglucanase